MKLTSFEISKKLAEIGFKANANFWWTKNQEVKTAYLKTLKDFVPLSDEVCAAYDLETLPNSVTNNNESFFTEDGDKGKLTLYISKSLIGYGMPDVYCSHVMPDLFFGIDKNNETVFKEEYCNDNLVDCTAKLLIKLHEQGLVKFGE